MSHPVMFDEDDPLLARLREVCRALPDAFELVTHGRPGFKAGEAGRLFAVYGGTRKVRPGEHERHDRALLFKPDPAEREGLLGEGRFFVPAYVGPSGWLGTDLDRADVDWVEVAELVDASYRLVASAAQRRRLTQG